MGRGRCGAATGSVILGASLAQAASLRQSSASVRFSASSSGEKACATRVACSGNRRSTSSSPRAVIVTAAARRSCAGGGADQPAALQRADDLRGVGLGGVQAAAQRAQLQLAVGGDEHDEDREAGGGQALALEVGESRRRTAASARSSPSSARCANGSSTTSLIWRDRSTRPDGA